MEAKQEALSEAGPKMCHHPLAKRAVLYTDTINGYPVCRDDMWAVTTDELNAAAHRVSELESILREAINSGALAGVNRECCGYGVATSQAGGDVECCGDPLDLDYRVRDLIGYHPVSE